MKGWFGKFEIWKEGDGAVGYKFAGHKKSVIMDFRTKCNGK